MCLPVHCTGSIEYLLGQEIFRYYSTEGSLSFSLSDVPRNCGGAIRGKISENKEKKIQEKI